MAKVEILKQETLLDKQFNIYGDFENPLFLAKDVAEWIEHSDTSTMVRTVDDEEKLIQTIFVSGQNREVVLLTENGVYEVLMQSRKPIAKKFKKGVKEVVKSIRKHGGYLTPQKLEEVLLSPDTLIQLATNLKIEQEKVSALEARSETQTKIINYLSPKADYYDNTLVSKDTMTTTQIAKELGMSAKALNKKLHSLGIQYSVNGQWLLYAKYQDKGYTKPHTYTEIIDNESRSFISTVWTQKGRGFIHQQLQKGA